MESNLSGLWSEKVLVITADYEIRGFIFMPKIGKKNRMLTDVLNSNKRFIAIKDAHITYRNSSREEEICSFIQININSIIIIRIDDNNQCDN